jgi:hypothetical protein
LYIDYIIVCKIIIHIDQSIILYED